MGRTYWSENDTDDLDVNFYTAGIIDRLTFCLWDKAGHPEPLSEADCKLIARIIRNYAIIMGNLDEDSTMINYFRAQGYPIDNIHDGEKIEDVTNYWNEVANWFEHCGGLIDEVEHCRRRDLAENNES